MCYQLAVLTRKKFLEYFGFRGDSYACETLLVSFPNFTLKHYSNYLQRGKVIENLILHKMKVGRSALTFKVNNNGNIFFLEIILRFFNIFVCVCLQSGVFFKSAPLLFLYMVSHSLTPVSLTLINLCKTNSSA